MDRKKFFTSISFGVVGIALFNNFPMKIISRQFNKNKKAVNVKVHPLAVSRKKIGEKNV